MVLPLNYLLDLWMSSESDITKENKASLIS